MDEVVYARVDKSIADPVIIIGAVSFVLIYMMLGSKAPGFVA